MEKISRLTLIFFIVFSTSSCIPSTNRVGETNKDISQTNQINTKTIDVSIKGNPDAKFNVELATSPQERSKGLMHRNNIEENSGMLFIFPKSKPLNFWMRNTPSSLDIIFINEDKTINSIHKSTIPFQESPTYNSDGNSLYVLEINSGVSDKLKLQIGDILVFDLPEDININ